MTQWAENDRTNGFNGYNGGFNTIKLELYIGFNTLMVKKGKSTYTELYGNNIDIYIYINRGFSIALWLSEGKWTKR